MCNRRKLIISRFRSVMPLKTPTMKTLITFIIILSSSLAFSQDLTFRSNPERYILGTQKDRTASISLGDINRDGIKDIITANIKEPNVIYFGSATLDFSSSTVFDKSEANSYSVSAGDLDQDGDIDLVIANSDGVNMVFENDDKGSKWLAMPLSDKEFDTYDIIIGDINGDGVLDILEANSDERNYFHVNLTKREKG